MKRAFTLIELLVVIAMIMVLVGAFVVSVNQARTRARIVKATQEAKELTNAILGYEQYARGRTLSTVATGGKWKDCVEGDLNFVLGVGQSASGDPLPVLFNGSLIGGRMVDPWGTTYQYLIEQTATQQGGGDEETRRIDFCTAPHLPNFFRLTDAERGLK